MYKKMSKIIIGFMVFSMVLTGMSHTKVQASTLEQELGIERMEVGEVEQDNRSKLTNEDSAQATVFNMLRRSYFMLGVSGIKVEEDGKVYITASAYAYQVVDTVYVHLALQRSIDGENWAVMTNFSKANYEESSVSAGYHLLVPKGYYYRLHSMHLVIHNDVSESEEAYTNGIMVD
jgi:hypothetical protein